MSEGDVTGSNKSASGDTVGLRNGTTQLIYPMAHQGAAGWNNTWSPGANHGVYARYIAPAAGTVTGVQVPVQATGSGNLAAAFYDVGKTTSGQLTQIQTSGSTAAVVGWQSLTWTAVPVAAGDHFYIGLWMSSATTGFGPSMLNTGPNTWPDIGTVNGVTGFAWSSDIFGSNQATALPATIISSGGLGTTTRTLQMLAQLTRS